MARLAPSHLTCEASREFHITCVFYSKSGDLLATYNYEVRVRWHVYCDVLLVLYCTVLLVLYCIVLLILYCTVQPGSRGRSV